MKKLACFALAIFMLTGCGNMDNTPTKKVENLLGKYQMNDSKVISDLDNVLMSDTNLTEDERNDYREFMKKHYQDMKYKIKEEKIDGDSATVDVEITVRDYSDAVNKANQYRLENTDEFDEDNTFATYRLDKLKDVDDTQTYTVTFHLTKTNNEWTIDPLSADDESKLNGLFGVSTIDTNYESSTNSTNDETNNTSNDTANSDNTESTSDNTNDTTDNNMTNEE